MTWSPTWAGWDPTSASLVACFPPTPLLQKEPDMLIHPWDAAVDRTEWQDWLGSTDPVRLLALNNLAPPEAPLVFPAPFTVAGDELLMHLARPTPVGPHREAAAEVRLAVVGDYA